MSDQLAVQTPAPFVKASTQLSSFLGIEPSMMIETIKAQCFKGKRPDEVSDAQLASFVSVCNGLQLNPLLPGMVYAYPERNGGITPIVGPDGTMKKIDEMISSGKLDGYTCDVYPEDPSLKATHATAIIYRKNSEHPAKYTAYFAEWNVGSNPNWQSRPRHMLWIRALKQAARQVIHGLPMDDDEYKIAQMTNVTESAPGEAAAPVAPDRPKIERAKKGAAKALETAAEAPTQNIATTTTVAEAPKPETTTVSEMPTQTARQADIAKASASAVDAEVTHQSPAGAGAAFEAAKVPAAPLTALKDKQEVTVVCEVVEFIAKDYGNGSRPNPAVRAVLKGEYNGPAFDTVTARLENGKVVHSAAWGIEGKRRFVLFGKARADAAGKPDPTNVAVMVKSIEVLDAPKTDDVPQF